MSLIKTGIRPFLTLSHHLSCILSDDFALYIILNFVSFAIWHLWDDFQSCSMTHEAKVYSIISMTRRGYTGDALRVCLRGECFHDEECSNHLACFDYQVNLVGDQNKYVQLSSKSFANKSSSASPCHIQII